MNMFFLLNNIIYKILNGTLNQEFHFLIVNIELEKLN